MAGLGATGASAAPTGWSAPQDLSGNFETGVQEGAAVNAPDIDVSGSGNAVAAWLQERELFTPAYAAEIWTSDRPLGGNWTPARFIGQGVGPRAATNAGTTVVAWTSGPNVLARVRRAGGDFSAARNLGAGAEARVGVDDGGVATVLWSGGGVGYGIRAARNEAAGGWTATTTISFSPTAQTPDLAVSGSGDAIATWKAQDGVRVTEFTPQSGWSAHHLVAPAGVRPSIATNDAGQVVLAWTGPAATEPPTESIHALTGTIRGGLANEKELSDSVLWDWWSDQPIAEAAMGRGGDAVVAWNRVVSAAIHTGTVEVSSTRVPDWGWTGARAISVPTFVPTPAVGVAPDGAALVVWRGGSASLRPADQAGVSPAVWTDPFALANPGADVYNPNIAVDDAGRMHVAWADLSRTRVRNEDHLLNMAVQATSFGSPGAAVAPAPAASTSSPAGTAPPASKAGGALGIRPPLALSAPKATTTIKHGTLYLRIEATLPRSLAGRTVVVQRRVGKRLAPLASLRVPKNGRVSRLIALNTNSNRGPLGVRDVQRIQVRITVAKTKKAAAVSSAYRAVSV